MIKKLKKRDGRIVDFAVEKVANAIWKAAQSVGGTNPALSSQLAGEVAQLLDREYNSRKIPTVEDVQDMIEKVLIESGHSQTSKAFILYRKKRQELREAKSALGIDDDMKLSFAALRALLHYKLLQKKPDGALETPRQMFQRVAHSLARAEKAYGGDAAVAEHEFEELLFDLALVPSAAVLRFAGTAHEHLSEAFVLPVEDGVTGLFDTLKQAAQLHKNRPKGFGVGFSFSSVRPRGSRIGDDEYASGPVAFLKLYDNALSQINPYGANLAFLNVHHPDVIDFITAKESSQLACFGTSVVLTREFMRAVEDDKMYELRDPHTNSVTSTVRARSVFDILTTLAWRIGDPAVVFLENLNKAPTNPFDDKLIEATTPTGEHPLFPLEGCFTASINLSRHITGNDFDWDKLKKTVWVGVHLLDNTIDVCSYPIHLLEDAMKSTRRIGLGIMGWADVLILLGIPYNSPDALKLGEKVMKFVASEAYDASAALARKRGCFGAYKKSVYAKQSEKMRNAARTTITHSAVPSIIAGCSQGIEPYYAVSYLKKTPTTESFEVIPLFETVARREGFYSPELMKSIALAGSVCGVKEIPEKWQRVFVTAGDCSMYDHLAVQVAFQKHTDNGVSKTINLPATATVEEIEQIYQKAYELGCKSVHVYREGSSTHPLITSYSHRVPRKKKRMRLEV